MLVMPYFFHGSVQLSGFLHTLTLVQSNCVLCITSMFFLPWFCLCCYPVQCDHVHAFCSSWILKCLSKKFHLNSLVADLKCLQSGSFFSLHFLKSGSILFGLCLVLVLNSDWVFIQPFYFLWIKLLQKKYKIKCQ